MIYIIILILLSQVVSQALREFVSFESQSEPMDMNVIWKYRCTRRFSPGMCLQQVSSVWTFDIQLQNCTERLGCLYARRANRFIDYFSCMRKCKYVIDVYSYIIMHENKNNMSESEDLLLSGRRDNLYKDIEYPEHQQTEDEETTAEDQNGDESFKYIYSDLEGGGEGDGEVILDY